MWLASRLGGSGETPDPWTPARVATAVRVLVLVLVFSLALASDHRTAALTWFPALVVFAILGTLWSWSGLTGLAFATVAAVGTVVAVLESGGATSPLFPYLIVPAFAGGLTAGMQQALVPPGFAGLALLAAGSVSAQDTTFAQQSAEWIVFAVVTGLTGAWIRSLLAPGADRTPADASYEAAYRLLAQLRPVARQLSVGLDPSTIAEGLLQALGNVCEFDRGVVVVRTGGGRPIVLAAIGQERTDWDVDVTGDGPFAEAWVSQRPQKLNRQFSGRPGSAIVVPLVIGLRTFGLVGLETDHRSFATLDPDSIREVTAEAALRLETAMLFDEVRGVATAEERRRVAREIHDGIAQELSYLGYFVDGLAAEAKTLDDGLTKQLQDLRQELTRIITELRLSIFDLRSEVDVHGGLGAALSDYVRSVGRQSGLTVHLSLQEATNRLPAETEAELLRIAQEAITNARKHASADNLWVLLQVEPPNAVLRVEDDGQGLGTARSDSYGLQIMRERAKRLRTTVQVQGREPRGTMVEVRLGGGVVAEGSTSLDGAGDELEELPQA